MKYLLSVFFFALFLLGGLFFSQQSYAAVATQSGTTNVTVTVSGNSLSVSGYIAPFASVVLTINGNVITSVVADANGNFTFTNVSVPKSTSTVCFNVVDFKKLGESQACISVTPVNGVITRTNLFLPPTLGIQRVEVTVGDSADVFGYGMPGAQITVHVTGLAGCVVTADANGYYQCSIVVQKAGQYELYADSVLKGKASEPQLKKVLLKGIAVIKPTNPPTPFLPTLPSIPWWLWLLLVLVGIILLIILLKKYKPQWLPEVGAPSVRLNHLFDFLFKERKLHHWWMKGVGY